MVFVVFDGVFDYIGSQEIGFGVVCVKRVEEQRFLGKVRFQKMFGEGVSKKKIRFIKGDKGKYFFLVLVF